jgi:hypothetical protein
MIMMMIIIIIIIIIKRFANTQLWRVR